MVLWSWPILVGPCEDPTTKSLFSPLPQLAQKSKVSTSVASEPKPIYILKAYYNSYSKVKKEQKCKDEDDYKDYDKEKDAKRIIETLRVCYIWGVLMTQAF